MPDDLNIVVPSGLGDFSWIYSKLCSLTSMMNVQVACVGGARVSRDGPPLSASQRLAPLLDILPKVKSITANRLSFPALRKAALPSNTTLEKLDDSRRYGWVYLEANTHIEQGVRIEKYLPDLPVDYHYPINITPEQAEHASKMVPEGVFFVIYASAVPTARAWNAWMPEQWVRFMIQCRRDFGDIPFVMVGAPWDKDMSDQIAALAAQNQIPLTDLVGKTHIAEVLHIISLSTYFTSFPSGLGILADVICASATMFYPTNLKKMVGSFADPESIETFSYHESVFVSPEEQVQWMRDVYCMEKRIA